MKIKTVCEEISRETKSAFDDGVNALLEDGWKLAKREIIPGYNLGDVYFPPCFYAELVKLEEADMEEQEAEPITWQEAVEVLRETCETAKECGAACPAFAWCQKNIPGNNAPPCSWGSSEELGLTE